MPGNILKNVSCYLLPKPEFMKGKIYLALLILVSHTVYSQTPENALPLSWFQMKGTARYQAIGGAMVSLGGDASANHINPAGLALFKTSDFLFTPGYQFDKVKSNYRGTDAKGDKKNTFDLGTSGFIFGGTGARGKNSFGITVTQLADFNQKIYYNGQNDYSSFASPLADEFSASHLTIDQALNSPNVSLPTKMSLYTYVVDTANHQVIARPENTSLLNQKNSIETNGGNTELTLGFGTEVNKKLLLGFSMGIDFIKYEKRTYYNESDATTNTTNDFKFLTYDENYSINGVGGVFKLGAIYRPKEYIRLGLAIHTPTWMSLTEKFNSGMAADLDNLFGPGKGYDSVASSVFTGNNEIKSDYQLNSPTRIMISGSYVFREEEKIERQKGFITADIEYTNYQWMKYTRYDENDGKDYHQYNQAIDALYKSAFNFRLGGELKFKTVMGRMGFAYYGNPYKESELKARKMILSGGLGYRNKGVFVDLTYFHHLNKNVNLPYRVTAPKANTFATLAENGGNIMLTVGFKI
jgi:hypothetical protein